jgi:hypothetical protein
MTPVILLTDGYIANAAEPWKVPDPAEFEPFPVTFLERRTARTIPCCPTSATRAACARGSSRARRA